VIYLNRVIGLLVVAMVLTGAAVFSLHVFRGGIQDIDSFADEEDKSAKCEYWASECMESKIDDNNCDVELPDRCSSDEEEDDVACGPYC